MAAVRQRETHLLKKAKDAAEGNKIRARERSFMKDSAGDWRAKVMPFLSGDTGTRRKGRESAREDACNIDEAVEISGEVEYGDDLTLTRAGYRRFRKDESDVEPDVTDQ